MDKRDAAGANRFGPNPRIDREKPAVRKQSLKKNCLQTAAEAGQKGCSGSKSRLSKFAPEKGRRRPPPLLYNMVYYSTAAPAALWPALMRTGIFSLIKLSACAIVGREFFGKRE